MTRRLPAGKIPPELLAELVGELGAAPPDVLLGPAPGEDACALAVGGGALVVSTDPVTLTGSDAGRIAVMVNANDVAVTGVRPRWFLATVLLPLGTTDDDVRGLLHAVVAALAEVGAVLVGGHTEVTAVVSRPVVVGQMSGYAADGRLVRTGGGRAGDVLVQIGPAPVEGAAVIAAGGHGRLAALAPGMLERAARAVLDPGICVVEPALAAAGLGATALHDPTEGGIAGGLHEVAAAAGLAAEVDRRRILWFEPGVAACRAVGADPLATLASGCVLAAFPPQAAASAVEALAGRGFAAAAIGRLAAGAGVIDERGAPLPLPARDEVARLAEEAAGGG